MNDEITEWAMRAAVRREVLEAERLWAAGLELPGVSVWESNIFHAGYLAGRRAAHSEQEGTRQNRSGEGGA